MSQTRPREVYNVPGGAVQLVEGGTVIATIGLNGNPSNDQATWTTPYLSPGTHSIQAIYEGNFLPSNNFTSSTGTMTQVVANSPPTLLAPVNQTNNQGDAVYMQLLASDSDGDSLGYSATGLPAGLALDPNTGLIKGGKIRKLQVPDPNLEALDWVGGYSKLPDGTIVPKPASATWPWYGSKYFNAAKGGGTAPLVMEDTPAAIFPKFSQFPVNPKQGLVSAKDSDRFVLYVGARTLDTENGASSKYWSEASDPWKVEFSYAVGAAPVAKVTSDDSFKPPAAPKQINVDVIPASIYGNAPYTTWVLQK